MQLFHHARRGVFYTVVLESSRANFVRNTAVVPFHTVHVACLPGFTLRNSPVVALQLLGSPVT